MTTSTSTRDAALRAWQSLFEGATPMGDVQPRAHTVCVGVIQRIGLVPGESVEAILYDGSGRLRAVWTGKEVMPGLELARGLRVAGTVCCDDGIPVMRNPSWCLVTDPYACAGDWAAKAREALRDA